MELALSWQATAEVASRAHSPQVLQQLDQCKAVPDFNNYLVYIFAQGDQLPAEVRTHAAWLE